MGLESWNYKNMPSVVEHSGALENNPTILDNIKEKSKNDISKLKDLHFQWITYEQLDKLSIEDRLQFVTLWKVDAKKLEEWSKIIFDFHNNKKLYDETSASFIFPSNILAIQAWGEIFSREKWKWEFFNKKGVRLIIWDSSDVERKWYSVVAIGKIKNKKKVKKEEPIVVEKQEKKLESLPENILTSISNIDSLDSLSIGATIELNFKWDKNLYKNTSAGDIIPLEFNFIKTIDGKIWKRDNSKWEFFSDNWKRLAIWDSKYLWYSKLEIISEAEVSNVSTYWEILDLNSKYRLQNISDFEWDSSKIENWQEVKFNFRNSSLSNSSLWQVMPIEVRSIIDSNGVTYNRLPVNRFWEFLDADMNRLKVKSWDSIIIGSTEYPEVIENKIKQHSIEIKSEDYKAFIRKQITKLSSEYWVPEKYVYSLLKWENQFWDYTLKVSWRDNTAYWLLQMTNDTWSKWWKWLDRLDPTDQLRAWIAYMKYIQELKNCDWIMAMTLYHTWPSILKVNSKNIARNLKWNPGIRNIIQKFPGVDMANVTPKNYLDWAYEYYKRKLV